MSRRKDNKNEKEEDQEDLRTELGLTEERADELVNIVNNMLIQYASKSEYGRTSHILLNIAGRKDLNDVEKAACIFIFCCSAMSKKGGLELAGEPKVSRRPEICMRHIPISEMRELSAQEFIDIEGGASGIIIAPEGLGPRDAIDPLMTVLMSMLRQMPKDDAKEFCKYASESFAKMASTGNIRQD